MRWPKTVQALLQPNWPGQLYYVRKNIFTCIFILDPSTDDGLRMAAMAEQMLNNQMPIRVGLALVMEPPQVPGVVQSEEHDYDLETLALGDRFKCPASTSSDITPVAPLAEIVIRLYRYARRKFDNRSALQFLSMLYSQRPLLDPKMQIHKQLDQETVLKIFTKWLQTKNQASASEAKSIFEQESVHKRYESAIENSRQYLKDKGFRKFPICLLNGIFLEGDMIQQGIMQTLHSELQQLQQLVKQQHVTDTTNIHDYLLTSAEAMDRFHPDTIEDQPTVVSLAASNEAVPTDTPISALSAKQLTLTMLQDLKYLPSLSDVSDTSVTPVTMWVVVDFASAAGVRLASEAISFLKTKPSKVRIAFIHNLRSNTSPDESQNSQAIAAAIPLQSNTTAMLEFMHIVCDLAKRNLTVPSAALHHVASQVWNQGDLEGFQQNLANENTYQNVVTKHRAFAGSVLGLKPGANALVTNGRIVLHEEIYPLSAQDLSLLVSTEAKARAGDVLKAVQPYADVMYQAKLEKMNSARTPKLSQAHFLSDVVMQASSVLLAPAEEKQDAAMRSAFMPPVFAKAAQLFKELTVTVPSSDPSPVFEIVAALNPLGKDTQKLAPVLQFLAQMFPISLKLILYPPSKMGELPYTNFYRYVLNDGIMTGSNSGLSLQSKPRAVFDKLPQKQLLTMKLDTPEAWLMEPVTSGHDLDNMKLSKIAQNSIYAGFKVAKLYVQGNCGEQASRQPPRGLQLQLKTAQQSVSDTLVMANLGYFQLKASPGAFNLSIVDGRSSELYSIHEGKGLVQAPAGGAFTMTVDSFTGRHISLKVQKREGKEDQDLLEAPEGVTRDLWGRLQAKLWGTETQKLKHKSSDETINIFSLASGHLYERFMRIMMLSVVKNTKSPVKFWMLKNFLSANFTDLVPKMAKKYNFKYELVTYQWPQWLQAQTEKQRIIWGYKILFLDVLFPLDVKKVIYIDADQVVKADIKELYDMSLDGAPLAMVPMGDSRKETEGFRFWKQGFWKSHLAGKPYHISALFVADLQMFRAVAAGDQLRIVYEQLSKDKNSLANLDQDLPNYAQHQIPIYSLPKDWLYCASWSSDADLKTAKTVDLCNNPLTKTPKLEMAKKIIPEWADLDAEVGQLEEEA